MGTEKGTDQAQARRGGGPSTNHTHESTNQPARVSVLSHVIMVMRGFVDGKPYDASCAVS